MTNILMAAVTAAILWSQNVSPIDACTTFCAMTGDAVLFGRNYDFEIGDGLLFVNTRGLAKQGFGARGPRWVARYGSVTFNQFGRDFPMGGINETGLVVELMWLDATQYPAPDDRAELGTLEWIQYQLDTAGSVADVVASDAHVRIAGDAPLHYLVSDPSGAAATIEFLNGRLVAHTQTSLPIAVLANSTYEQSLQFWRRRGEPSLPGGSGSDERFARTATQVRGLKELVAAHAVDRAFAILANAAQRSTRWTIVYDQTNRVVRFRTDRNPAIRELRMKTLDFSCGAPVRLVDLQERTSGDVSAHLQPYTAEANAALVARTYPATSVTRRTPATEIQAVARHPNQSACASRPAP
jgi:penicillin V acylase-like amidase (Ntn superfamily)